MKRISDAAALGPAGATLAHVQPACVFDDVEMTTKCNTYAARHLGCFDQ